MNKNKIINDYLNYIKIKNNVATTTIYCYQKDLEFFFDYLSSLNINVDNFDDEKLYIFNEFLIEKYKISSVVRKISSIKSFIIYLFNKKYIKNILNFSKVENKNCELFHKSYNKNKLTKTNVNEIYDNLSKIEFKNIYKKSIFDLIFKILEKIDMDLNKIILIENSSLIKYDFKKIVLNIDNRIFAYDIDEDLEKNIREFYKSYSKDKKLLFENLKYSTIYSIFKENGIYISKLKNIKKIEEDDLQEKIKEEYFKINIGDR